MERIWVKISRMSRYAYLRIVRIKAPAESIALGLAVGVFSGAMPFLSLQMFIAVSLALLLRGRRYEQRRHRQSDTDHGDPKGSPHTCQDRLHRLLPARRNLSRHAAKPSASGTQDAGVTQLTIGATLAAGA